MGSPSIRQRVTPGYEEIGRVNDGVVFFHPGKPLQVGQPGLVGFAPLHGPRTCSLLSAISITWSIWIILIFPMFLQIIQISSNRVIIDVAELDSDLSKHPPVASLLYTEHVLHLVLLHRANLNQEIPYFIRHFPTVLPLLLSRTFEGSKSLNYPKC